MTGIIFLGAIAALMLIGLYFYIKHVKRSLEKYLNLSKEHFFAPSWLLLCFLPVLGDRWLARVNQYAQSSFEINLSQTESNRSEPVNVDNSNWLLLEEQFDNQNGDHVGTRVIPLDTKNEKSLYKIVTPVEASRFENNEEKGSVHNIYIRSKEKLGFEKHNWIYLRFNRTWDNWVIENISRGNHPIPLLVPSYRFGEETRNYKVVSLPGGGTKRVSHGTKFILSESEFEIVKLPQVCVKFYDGNKKLGEWTLPHKGVFWIGYDRGKFFPGVDISEKVEKPFYVLGDRLFIIQDGFSLRCLDPVEQNLETDEIEVSSFNSGLRLEPGWRFEKEESNFYFFIEYLNH